MCAYYILKFFIKQKILKKFPIKQNKNEIRNIPCKKNCLLYPWKSNC